MPLPTQAVLFDALDATWAAKAFHKQDGWLIREGDGGGQRVSAATLLGDTKGNCPGTKLATFPPKIACLRQFGVN